MSVPKQLATTCVRDSGRCGRRKHNTIYTAAVFLVRSSYVCSVLFHDTPGVLEPCETKKHRVPGARFRFDFERLSVGKIEPRQRDSTQRGPCTRTSARPPTNPSSTDSSGKRTTSSKEFSVVPTLPTRPPPLPLLPPIPPPSPPSTVITSKSPCPSVEHERGGGGKSSRVRQIRRRAAVSWNRTQRSPAEVLTRKTPVPGQGNRTLARGRRPKSRRAAALHWNRASAGVVVAAVWSSAGGLCFRGPGRYERHVQFIENLRENKATCDNSNSFSQLFPGFVWAPHLRRGTERRAVVSRFACSHPKPSTKTVQRMYAQERVLGALENIFSHRTHGTDWLKFAATYIAAAKSSTQRLRANAIFIRLCRHY